MRSHLFDFPGVKRNYDDLLNGFSLGIGIALILVGVLFLMLGRATEKARPAALTGALASLLMLINAAVLFPLPPIILFAIASVAFGVALWPSGRVSGLPVQVGARSA